MGKLNIGPMDLKEMLERVNTSLLKYKKPLHTLELESQDVQFKIDDLSTLKSMLGDLKSKLTAASTAFNPALIVNSSNTSVLSATSATNTLNATASSHKIQVTQLAQAQSTASVSTFTSAQTMTAETLTITMGANHFDINVAATDTLQGVISKINSAADNVGVNASMISTNGTDYQLILNSKNSGAASAFTISESLGSPQFDVSQVIYAAQDAGFLLDDTFAMTRSTNNISDVVTGVNIQLLSLGTSNIIITQDADKTSTNAKTAIQNVLDSYNKLMLFIDKVQTNGLIDPIIKYKDESDPNATTNQRNESVMMITNDPIFSQIKNLIQTQMAGNPSGTNKYNKLEDVGIVLGQAVKFDATYGGKAMSNYSSGNLEFYKNSKVNGLDPLEQLFSTSLDSLPEVNKLFFDPTDGIFTKLGKTIDNDIMLGTAGIIDKHLNGTNGLAAEKSRLSGKIELETKSVEDMRLMLVDKYASLNMVLTQFEYTSKYLDAQFESFNKK
ncbi:MAG: flagellar filament capping protein FliD [Gammaproteobacteria bacterium]